ncbi:hypothetical protein GGI12_000026 [Dipsacomyces acuminosporus]|nr:hypothetical protein GGI12_000026 [Dipsacomyces acuminosporus]
MSTIEQQILSGLQGQAGGEDLSEQIRAAENGDRASQSDDDDSGSSDAAQLAAPSNHNGPQTGVKGVIADYRHHRMQEQQRHSKEMEAAKAEYAAAAQRNIGGGIGDKTMWTKDDGQNEGEEDSFGLDDEDDDDAQFFDEYRKRRMAEMSRAAERSMQECLKDVSPNDYVDIVEQQADSGAFILVLLVDDDVAASQRFEAFLRTECTKHPQAVFLRVQAAECGFTDADVLPILLVYRHGELKHNLVRVADCFSDPCNFGSRDVAKLLSGILHK